MAWPPLAEIKKTVVFLGKKSEKGESGLSATGFLLSIHGIPHLTTAKHVVVRPETGESLDSDMLAYFNLKQGGIGSRPIEEIKRDFGVRWIFHEDANVDIAMIPFGLNRDEDDVKTFPDNMFVALETLSELYDIFFLSYQPGIEPQDRISPVLRTGTISLVNADYTFYIDAAAFPGNSGSPVFVKPSAVRFDEGGIRIGTDQLGGKFVGLVGEYLPYREVAISAQTGRPRVVFEENTGLSRVWSTTRIMEILKSESMEQQVQELRARKAGS
jgi:hypothetical protein